MTQARLALEAVVKTAASDPEATEELLRETIDPVRLQERGYLDLPVLADAVSDLAVVLPEFVEDLYVAAMTFEETSTDPTTLVSSPLLPLSSTQAQDYRQARWSLADNFGGYLERHRQGAVSALVRIIEEEHCPTATAEVDLGEWTISIHRDGSDRWDVAQFSDGADPPALLEAFETHLAGLESESEVAAVLGLLADQQVPAALWRRVLEAAADNELLADELGPPDELAKQHVVDELEGPLGVLVVARHRQLTAEDRARLEAAIVQLKPPGPDEESPNHQRLGQRYRRLVHGLDGDRLTNPTLREDQQSTDSPPEQPPVVSSFEPPADPVDRYGITLDTDHDQTVWSLLEDVLAFTDSHHQDGPTTQQVADSLPAVRDLWDNLQAQPPSEDIRRLAEDTVAAAAERWTRAVDQLPPAVLQLAREILLRAAGHPCPEPRPDADQDDIELVGGPRREAAKGLPALARRRDHCDSEILDALRRLATDPVASIRYETIRRLRLLHQSAEAEVWELLREVAATDGSDGVLRVVVSAAYAWHSTGGGGLDVIRTVADRAEPRDTRQSAVNVCTTVAGLLWVEDGNKEAKQLVERFMDRDRYRVQGLCSLLHELSSKQLLTTEDTDARRRALQLCDRCAEAGLGILEGLEDSDELTEAQDHRAKAAARLLETVAGQLYVASGAQDDASSDREEASPSAEAVRLFDEAAPLLDKLAEVPFAQTAHRLIEWLEYMLDSRPEQVLRAVGDVVRTGGTAGGYELDTLAVKAIARIIKRLLADHRDLLHDSENLTVVRESLEVFVEVGWPAAHRLVFDFESSFR